MTDATKDFLQANPKTVVLTGAGISLASGIPTYRDSTGKWQRNDPIQHRDFVEKPTSRQRYWARSYAGWPAVGLAKPNAAHLALAQLEAAGLWLAIGYPECRPPAPACRIAEGYRPPWQARPRGVS